MKSVFFFVMSFAVSVLAVGQNFGGQVVSERWSQPSFVNPKFLKEKWQYDPEDAENAQILDPEDALRRIIVTCYVKHVRRWGFKTTKVRCPYPFNSKIKKADRESYQRVKYMPSMSVQEFTVNHEFLDNPKHQLDKAAFEF